MTNHRPHPAQPRALAVFLVICFLFGGGSRSDVASIIVLRPLAFLFLGYAIAQDWPSMAKNGRAVLWFGGAIAVVTAAQLVPLPPMVWTNLPGREPLAAAADAIGMAQPWRPVSMVPWRTANALAALVVPLAAVALALASRPAQWGVTLLLVIAIGVVSAVLGLLQAIGPAEGPLYLYRHTNNGVATGLFANRNHQAALLACLFPCLAVAASLPQATRYRAQAWTLILIAIGIFLIPLLVLTGSRAGLVLGFLGLASIPLLYRAPDASRRQRAGGLRAWRFGAGAAVAAGVFTAVLLVALTIFFSRAAAVDRVIAAGAEGSRRLDTLIPVLTLIWQYFPIGIGAGAFAEVYRIGEPDRLLGATYLNQAHNDWASTLIEGGAAGGVLLAVAVLVIGRRAIDAFAPHPNRDGWPRRFARLGAVILALLGAASIVDYPLRTPSLGAFAALALAWLIIGTAQGDLAAKGVAAPRGSD